MQALYGGIDRAIDHVRRYDREALVAQLERHGFEIVTARYFNWPGMIGWYLNSVLLNRRTVPGVQARLANLLVPWLRFETGLDLKRGMGLIVIARKTAESAAAMPFAMPDRVAH